MRIVLDLEGVQLKLAANKNSDQAFLLTQAIVRNCTDHDVIVALSGTLGDTIEPVRAALNKQLPQASIRVWHAPSLAHKNGQAGAWREKIAKRIRQAFITSLRPSIVILVGGTKGLEDKTVSPLTSIKITDAKLTWQELYLPTQQTSIVPPEQQAQELIQKIEKMVVKSAQSSPLRQHPRQRLAYISPLPPERSGIADYSAELLPELARFYAIDVIVAQDEIADSWVIENCPVRTADWLCKNAHLYDRVLYHFGNSSYHQHMFDLLTQVPGVILLHDFYLGDVRNYLEAHGIQPNALSHSLYCSHGYGALAERFGAAPLAEVIRKYPSNLDVLQTARGVIVHSQHSRQLASTWYGRELSEGWQVIPLLRGSISATDRTSAKQRLGFKPNEFLICSFGVLGASKLNDRILRAWLDSRLAPDEHCRLVFVGEEQDNDYCARLRSEILSSGIKERIRIVGWVDSVIFHDYLAAADIAVQLRTFSRGETSAAALDCMNHGLPTIVNAHGALAELPTDAVWMLPDIFENTQLVEALETLWQDNVKSKNLSKLAQQTVQIQHAPQVCAEQFAEAIEQTYAWEQFSTDGLTRHLADEPGHSPDDAECIEIAQAIARSLPQLGFGKQILIDVSATCREDLHTGIQRVVRALTWELLQSGCPGTRIEPVYLSNEGGSWHYCYAREWTTRMLGCAVTGLTDQPIDYCPGDVLLIADFTSTLAIEATRTGVYEQFRVDGVGIYFVVYDLLPIIMPEYFPPGEFGYLEWLHSLVSVADGALCISAAVAGDLQSWVISNHSPSRLRPLNISWFHLGADIENSVPSKGTPKNSEQILATLSTAPSFLMVGTIEPRKGHLQTIDAFSKLWQEGLNVNLVIVGNEGWNRLPDNLRRTIPEIAMRLRSHAEFGKRLLWLQGTSDEFLEKIYTSSHCLIAASEGEGFGLPLIEAAQRKLPIIARDIPVFKEVAGTHAYYFSGLEAKELASAINRWLELAKRNLAPSSRDMPWLTWKQSAANILAKINNFLAD